MAILNTTGIKSDEKNGITEAGTYVLKITKYEVDGYNNNGDEKFKLFFEGKKVVDGKLSDNMYSMLDWLDPSEKLIWKIARLRDALKSPELFDLDDWVGRYVVAVVEMNTYNGKTNPQFKSLSYSKANDNLPPILEAKSVQDESKVESENQQGVTMDINEDEIPFAPISKRLCLSLA